MLNRMISGIGLTLVFIGTLTLAFEILQTKPAIGKTWFVGPPPADFQSIQEAIYNGSVTDGDIIEVMEVGGPYYEHVTVNKSLTIRRWEYDTTSPVIDGWGIGTVVNITARNVRFDGFTVQNGRYGICVSNQSAIIFNNSVAENDYGIYLFQSYNNTLKENKMIENTWNFGVEGNEVNDFIQHIDVSNTVDGKAIHYLMNQQDRAIPSDSGYVGIVNCVNITVEGLDMTHNREGVLIVNSTGVAVKNVSITSSEYGIWALMMDDSNITNAEVSNNDFGVKLGDSSHNIIGNNLMVDNGRYAWTTIVIDLEFSSYNTIVDNELSSQYNYSDFGVSLGSSSNNTIVGNTMKMHWCGIHLYSSSGNVFYHNNIIDSRWEQAWTHTSPDNRWDNGHEGNYWSDYLGEDADGNGIGDEPYNISNSAKDDEFPLWPKPWAARRVFQPEKWKYVETPEKLNRKLSTFSNATLASLCLSRELQQISLKATSGYSGFLNITIPRKWLDGPFEVKVDEVDVGYFCAPQNTNYSFLCITFDKGNHTIKITGTQLGTILGDIDEDGDFDLYDAIELLKYYGHKDVREYDLVDP